MVQTWKTSEPREFTCPNSRAVYEVRVTRLPVREETSPSVTSATRRWTVGTLMTSQAIS
jgi:hypothetical protein